MIERCLIELGGDLGAVLHQQMRHGGVVGEIRHVVEPDSWSSAAGGHQRQSRILCAAVLESGAQRASARILILSIGVQSRKKSLAVVTKLTGLKFAISPRTSLGFAAQKILAQGSASRRGALH